MSTPSAKDPDTDTLRFIIENVFVPPKLPQKAYGEQIEQRMNVALCGTLVGAALDFLRDIPSSQHPLWMKMIKMMELAGRVAEAPFEEAELQRIFSKMVIGGMFILSALSSTAYLTLSSDVFLMHIRAQNAALIVRRLSSSNFVQFEVFEVLPQNTAVMTTKGKLLCSYPGPAIQVPTDIFTDKCFSEELSSFLIQMDIDPLDSTPTTSKAGSVVKEVRESAHPRYISELLVGILRGCGQPAAVDRITKRIGDEVLWDNAYKPWRRSPLWLTIRVSLQSSLCSTNLYKPFILFFHAYLLRRCVLRDFPSELLYAMRVKTARRLSKLDPAVSDHIYKFIHDTFKETEALLSKRWTTFQAVGSISRPLQPPVLDFVGDTEITLPNSYDYLTKIRLASNGPSQTLGVKKKKKGPSTLSQIPFTPSCISRLRTLHDFGRFMDGQLADAIAKDRLIAITDFESAVETNLQSWLNWVATFTHNDDTPDVIASCIQQYYDGAKDHYRADAEGNSIMILTIMDLWVALDTSTIQQCPLLKQYSPEIPSDFLHPLLLHRSSTLTRAWRIEEYLCRRRKEARDATSIFSNNISESSFAVKYFRASEDLRRLNDKIIADAQQNRAKKRAELNNLNQTSASLLEEAFCMDHEWEMTMVGTEWVDWHNRNSCEKCQLEHQARALRICVHEWPLPRSTVHAQQAVFELSPPRAFSVWRDITYLILCDIGLSSNPDVQGKPKVEVHLDSFSGLHRWTAKHQKGQRLTIASTTKSFSDQTHYKTIRIPAEESSVLVNNGLSFSLFDRVHKSWTMDSFASSNVSKMCTPLIPSSSPYSRLRRYLSGTQHPPNDILTAQADCPKEINLHELVAFSGLRSGPRLQWLNIARELASPYLSFYREEVNILITQAAWQLGPLSDGDREWHIDLNVPSFGNILLHELDSLLKRIGGNWLEEVTVRTIGVLHRYLSLGFFLIAL